MSQLETKHQPCILKLCSFYINPLGITIVRGFTLSNLFKIGRELSKAEITIVASEKS
jgi:hypothetical protein